MEENNKITVIKQKEFDDACKLYTTDFSTMLTDTLTDLLNQYSNIKLSGVNLLKENYNDDDQVRILIQSGFQLHFENCTLPSFFEIKGHEDEQSGYTSGKKYLSYVSVNNCYDLNNSTLKFLSIKNLICENENNSPNITISNTNIEKIELNSFLTKIDSKYIAHMLIDNVSELNRLDVVNIKEAKITLKNIQLINTSCNFEHINSVEFQNNSYSGGNHMLFRNVEEALLWDFHNMNGEQESKIHLQAVNIKNLRTHDNAIKIINIKDSTMQELYIENSDDLFCTVIKSSAQSITLSKNYNMYIDLSLEANSLLHYFTSQHNSYDSFRMTGVNVLNALTFKDDHFYSSPKLYSVEPSEVMDMMTSTYAIDDRYALQTLRKMMQKINDPVQEMFFFKLEMDSRLYDEKTPFMDKLWLRGYKIFDYGSSVTAPLILWLMVMYIASVGYMNIPNISGGDAVISAVQNGLLYLGGKPEIQGNSGWVLLQKLISFPLLFLFGLAVRNTLRMR